MLIEAKEFDGQRVECDICIIGAGAAGISIAVELAETNKKVILLESGGLDFDAETQALYEGTMTDQQMTPMDVSRLRFFGGTTNHWTGMSHPLEPFDLMKHEWIDNSGWPIDFSDIEPYFERASQLCQLGRNEYRPEILSDAVGQPFPNKWLKSGVFRHSPPTRFGETYRQEIEKAQNIRTLLNANVVAIEADETVQTVTHVVVKTLSGETVTVAAGSFVLACGGIENSRLLLSSNSRVPAGLGNQNDMVGRYFMEHPYALRTALVEMLTSDERILFYGHHADKDGFDTHLRGFFAPTYETMKQYKLLNFGFSFVRYDFAEESPGLQSAKRIFNDVGNLGQHIANIVSDFDSIAYAAYRKFAFSVPVRFFANCWVENAPVPDGRIVLTDDRDALQMRRAAVNWTIGEEHLRTMRIAHELLARQLGELGAARIQLLKSFDTVESLEFGSSEHHMGGTRMSDDPKRGVVDSDCRVHGLDNLYVASSSVFPTGGHTNPTLNLIALALRLTDHLKSTSV